MKERNAFFQAVLPSMLAFALSGVYAIVDGFFLGHAMGDHALAAVNMAYPITAFLQAVGTGIGMGGAVCYAISLGRRRIILARKYFGMMVLALAVSGIGLTVLFLTLAPSVLSLFGAQGTIFALGQEYLLYISFGALFQVLGTGLVPLIRNMGGAVFAMAAMIAGFLTNILLDWLLVWVIPWGMMGAAVLGARGAVHSGIGVLHCHVPAGCGEVMQAAVPEAVLEADVSECCFSGVKEEDLTRWNAVAVGPGIGKGEETVEGVRRLLQEWRGRLILDADALNILAEHRELLECLHGDCLLTPHVKEFERLAGKCGNDFERLNKLLTFAKRYQVHVVLKGAYSAVAVPEGRLYFNMSGNPGMAKGGSGDVLTGVLLALAANGMPMGDVARAGVFAHGLSGDLLAERVGQRGVTAGSLAENMGCAWKVIEETKY